MWLNIILIVLAIVAYIYYCLVKNYGIFKKMGVVEHKYVDKIIQLT